MIMSRLAVVLIRKENNMKCIKLNDNQIKIVETKNEVVERVYDYNFLIQQRKDIQTQRDRDNAQRDLELKEVTELIAKCKELGIGEKEVEEKLISE